MGRMTAISNQIVLETEDSDFIHTNRNPKNRITASKIPIEKKIS